MDVCSNCGRTRKQETAFCTGCGRRFVDDNPQPIRSDNPLGLPGPPPPSDFPGPSGSYAPAGSYSPTATRLPTQSRRPADSQGPAESQGPLDPRGPAGPWPPAEGYRSPPPSRPFTPPGPEPGPSHRSRRSRTGFAGLAFKPVALAAVVLLIAVASGAVLYLRYHTSHAEAERNPVQSTRTTPPAQDASVGGQDASAPAPGSSDTSPDSSGAAGVTVGAGASQDTAASSVAGFLGQYFAAINAHDYQSYFSMLSPQVQQGMTQAQFEKGYRSTADSNETLVGISTASDGDLAAEVTFTSHQNPANSPDQSESCTDWDITLFLAQSGSGYVIDPAPADYHASYQPCS
jgi:hypothetical protein